MFDMQKLAYFTEGNRFAGSHTEGNRIIRYRVDPHRENEKLLVWCWHEDKCFEKAKEKSEGSFPLTQDGLNALILWLQKEFEEHT